MFPPLLPPTMHVNKRAHCCRARALMHRVFAHRPSPGRLYSRGAHGEHLLSASKAWLGSLAPDGTLVTELEVAANSVSKVDGGCGLAALWHTGGAHQQLLGTCIARPTPKLSDDGSAASACGHAYAAVSFEGAP